MSFELIEQGEIAEFSLELSLEFLQLRKGKRDRNNFTLDFTLSRFNGHRFHDVQFIFMAGVQAFR